MFISGRVTGKHTFGVYWNILQTLNLQIKIFQKEGIWLRTVNLETLLFSINEGRDKITR